MTLAIAALVFMFTQKAADQDTSTLVIHEPIVYVDADTHGCTSYFVWDEGRGVCKMSIEFSPPAGDVVCSPLATGVDGKQRMICWYKPAATHDSEQ